jgi:hypothetical protein
MLVLMRFVDTRPCISATQPIEAIIGHPKSDHSMGSSYLKGRAGDMHRALLAGMGFNLILLLSAWAGHFLAVMLWAFFSLIPSRPLRLAQNDTGP